jgi:hypothetical protein
VEREQGAASLARRFAEDLNELRQRAGNPSYSTLERLSGRRLRRATLSDVLNGNRLKPPDWPFVAAFVEACGTAARDAGLDQRALGSLADWKRHWDAAVNGVIEARFPGGRLNLSPATTTPSQRNPVTATTMPGQPSGSLLGGVPPRETDFIGREEWVAAVRAALAAEDKAAPVVIQGIIGTGKTQLAIEYAYQYAHDYDLVWWIPCDDVASAHEAVRSLEARFGFGDEPKAPDGGRHEALFDALRRGNPYAQWLLIFDNADDPEDLVELLPRSGGHVLITSRNSRWEARGRVLDLDVFTREESVAFLRRRIHGIKDSDAHRLAEATGDLPLLLEHAAEARLSIDTYLERLNQDPLDLLGGEAPGYPGTVAGAWTETIARLRDYSPDALGLLSCLSFFGGESIPREALQRGAYLAGISMRDILGDPIRSNRAIMMLRRAGLVRVDVDARTLHVHPLTRRVVRDMVARGGAGDIQRGQHDAHLLLAAADPLSPSDPATWRTYAELGEHIITQPDVLDCPDPATRRLVINYVQYLYASGDLRDATGFADEVIGRWSAGRHDDSPGLSDVKLAKAEGLLSLGYPGTAPQILDIVSAARRDRSAARSFEAGLLLKRIDGARLRAAGKFGEALAVDQERLRESTGEFGRDHPSTLTVAASVINDLALIGEHDQALRLAGHAYQDCLAFYGIRDHPAVLVQRNLLARCMLLVGRSDEALEFEAEVHSAYSALIDGGFIDRNHPWILANELDLAAARLAGSPGPAELEQLTAAAHDVRRRCWRALGADHPQTLSAAILLGTMLRRIPGRTGEAARVVSEAGRRYGAVLPGHPYAYASAALLASIRRQGGSPEGALLEIERAIAGLNEGVGPDHPYTLAAAVAQMNAMADTGAIESAIGLGQQTLGVLWNRLGLAHPDTLACAANIRGMLSAHDREDLQPEIMISYLEAIRSAHPSLIPKADPQRFDLTFMPLPL